MTVSSRVFLTVILTALLPILSIGTVTKKAVADPLVVDLSNHLVAITTGFTGTKVLLFGAVEDEGDVIVTVRGPDQDMVVSPHLKFCWITASAYIINALLPKAI